MENSAFTLLDWLVLGGYLLLATGIGLYLSGRNKSYNDYMFGAGKMPWLAVGISLIATSVSATTFLGNPSDTFRNNMAYIMCNIGGLLGALVVWKVFIPRFREANVKSAYEILEQKFDRPVRLLAASLYCLHLILRTGILLYGPALVLGPMLGIPIYVAILLTSILAVLYTWFGGIKAVIWTDVLQFVVLFGGGITVLILVSNAVGGFSSMASMASAAGKTEWLNLSMDPSNARTLLSAGLIYMVFEVAIRGCDQQFIQRYLSCGSTKEANYSSMVSIGLGFVIGLLFYWVGAALYVYFEVVGVSALPAGIKSDGVFPHYILNVLPAGLTGLLTAAIYAAAMSSLDSAITALSNTTVVDFYRNSEDQTEKKSISRAHKWVVIWGVIGTGAAFVAAMGEKSLLTKALFFTSLFTGPLLGMMLMAFFRSKTHPKAVFSGAIIGMVTLGLFSKVFFIPSWEPLYNFSWPWNPLISLTGMIVGTLMVDAVLKVVKRPLQEEKY